MYTDLLGTALEEDDLSDSSDPPPLEILLYAIKSILYPTFLYEQIDAFLRLLTMIEFHRIRATTKATSAHAWQLYFKSNPNPDVILLSEPVEEAFKEHKDQDADWRAVFMKIVSTCITIVCRFHLISFKRLMVLHLGYS